MTAIATFDGPSAAPVLRVGDPPLPGPGAAVVSVLACALDADDLARWRDSDGSAAWPATLGRHFVGGIEALGAGLATDVAGEKLRPGTPVLVPSVIPCGRCASCTARVPGCLAPRRLGHGAGAGGLAEAVVAEPGMPLHALPVTQPPWIATLAEPFAATLQALGQAQSIGRMPPGARIAIHGSTATAILAVMAALELGAGRVIVVGGPDVPGLRLARLFGAEATIDATDVTSPADRADIVRETLGGRGADLALACAGEAAGDAADGLREGGCLIALGGGTGALPWATVHRKGLTVVGMPPDAPGDIPTALRLLYRFRDRYPLGALHERFPFTAAGVADALAALAEGRILRALIVQRPDLAG